MVAEVRNGIQTIDHIAIPVRDLQRNQDFYVNVISFSSKVQPFKSSRCEKGNS
jgi:hypothetical protein